MSKELSSDLTRGHASRSCSRLNTEVKMRNLFEVNKWQCGFLLKLEASTTWIFNKKFFYRKADEVGNLKINTSALFWLSVPKNRQSIFIIATVRRQKQTLHFVDRMQNVWGRSNYHDSRLKQRCVSESTSLIYVRRSGQFWPVKRLTSGSPLRALISRSGCSLLWYPPSEGCDVAWVNPLARVNARS